MICPICQKGHMLETAPEMLQCAACGNGSTGRGFHYSWSLSSLDSVEGSNGRDIMSGITITYNPIRDIYTIGTITWQIDGVSTLPIPHTVDSEILDTISETEYADYAMPVVWLGKPGKLKKGMYKTTLGRKEKT